MRKLILLAALIAAPAFAQDMQYVSGDKQLIVRLTAGECVLPALAAAIAQGGAVTPPRAASISNGRIELRGCWAIDADNDVLVGDELGNSGYLPMTAFKPVPTI